MYQVESYKKIIKALSECMAAMEKGVNHECAGCPFHAPITMEFDLYSEGTNGIECGYINIKVPIDPCFLMNNIMDKINDK